MHKIQTDGKSRQERCPPKNPQGSFSRSRAKEVVSRQDSIKKNHSIGPGPKIVSVNLEDSNNSSSTFREGDVSGGPGDESSRMIQRRAPNCFADNTMSAVEIASLIAQKKRKDEFRNLNHTSIIGDNSTKSR